MTLWFLSIAGQLYSVEPLKPTPSVAKKAWRVTKITEGERVQYDVHLNQHGWSCTCGSFHWRKERAGEECKHVTAIRDMVQEQGPEQHLQEK